jgi:predicted ATP-grasp superfamily ATP-dependent carboligase
VSKFKHPAIVIGMALGGLGVTRSLAKRGVKVYCIDTDLTTPEMKTNKGTKVKFETIKEDKFIVDLIKFCQSLDDKPVIFTTIRIPATLLSKHRKKFKNIAFINMPSEKHLAELENKYFIEKYANKAKLNIPLTAYVDHQYTREKLKSLTYPCIIKPDDNSIEFAEHFQKAKIAKNFDEMRTYIDTIFFKIPKMKLVIQEFILGGDELLFFCLQYRSVDNQLLSSFVGRKILSWPRDTGRTCSCAPYNGPIHDKIKQLTTDFFNAIPDFKGFCSLEFKYDKNRQDLYLIEPTVGRTDFQQEIATLNNENMPFKAYLDQINLSDIVRKKMNKKSILWFDPSVEKWAKQQDYNQKLDTSFKRQNAFFRWSDPMPFINLLNNKIYKKLSKINVLKNVRNLLNNI